MNNIEYKLASRTAQSDRSSRSSVMMLIATISVALGTVITSSWATTEISNPATCYEKQYVEV